MKKPGKCTRHRRASLLIEDQQEIAFTSHSTCPWLIQQNGPLQADCALPITKRRACQNGPPYRAHIRSKTNSKPPRNWMGSVLRMKSGGIWRKNSALLAGR
jgi:hypothetical protein